MNRCESDILITLANEKYSNQRVLAEKCGYSLGSVNSSVKKLIDEAYLDEKMNLTDKTKRLFEEKKPQNAIILAAGVGMRMVPINTEIPKALLEIKGETLIERTIRQLREAGIQDIYVVVGYKKDEFEYLIDEYDVRLIVNEDYAEKNNLHSLKLVSKYLSNSYIVPCDVWCQENPYQKNELYSWYMVSEEVNKDSYVRVNRKMELVGTNQDAMGNRMIGISYLQEEQAKVIRTRIEQLCADQRYDNAFWEETLWEKNKFVVQGKVVKKDSVTEINTYEQLRELDHNSNQLETDSISIIEKVFDVDSEDIKEITVLKKGMTNRSFLFTCKDKKYIMRIPGEGTEQLINRKEEGQVYQVIADRGICDDIAYMNPENGYKITAFLEGARVCDPFNEADVKRTMKRLRNFHQMKLQVDHEFDIFKQIEFYESLWEGRPSVFRDYRKTKEKVFSLKSYIDAHAEEKTLTHIDAVPDNFLFVKNENGEEEIRLIDWEYAGMQDPHVDIAMFCIYAMYDRDMVDRLIDAYFTEGCLKQTRVKIYCYIAACGLLWSNWCEYKRSLGVEFGEYSLRQYRYAKEYYKIVQEELEV